MTSRIQSNGNTGRCAPQRAASDRSIRARDEDLLARVRYIQGSGDERVVLVAENLANLSRLHAALYEALGKWLAPYGLTPARLNVLCVLGSAPNQRSRMCEISANVSVTRANITKLIDGLERDGLVARTGYASDRRVVVTELTEAGADLLARAVSGIRPRLKLLWSQFTDDECLQLTHLLVKARVALGAVPGGAARHRSSSGQCRGGSDE